MECYNLRQRERVSIFLNLEASYSLLQEISFQQNIVNSHVKIFFVIILQFLSTEFTFHFTILLWSIYVISLSRA